MIQLTRRDLLAGTAATTAALSMGLTPSELRAATPLAGKQAPGFYRYKIGDFEVTQIADGARTFPMPDTFVVNQKKEDALAAAEAAYMPKGQVTIPFNPMVINTGSKLVVIDTGNGLGAFEQSKGVVGQMNANMTAAGIDPKNGRHRGDLALPRRPHERPEEGGRLAGLSERRDHGAGRRMGVLVRRGERRQGERLQQAELRQRRRRRSTGWPTR